MTLNFSETALIIIDVQNDFCPGGALAIERGDTIVKVINSLSSLFASRSAMVAASQDWHPKGHASFASTHGRQAGTSMDLPNVKDQTLWPDHCVQGSEGADFHMDLDLNPVNLIIRKGFRMDLDSYSVFFENDRKTATGLDAFLKTHSINTVLLGGLATDYCVLYSALDAVSLGYKTIIAEDAVMGVNFPIGSVEAAIKKLKDAGVIFINSEQIK